MERIRLVPIDAKIFGVDANMVGIKTNANVEITNQNIPSKSLCIDSCQYIHFQYLRLDCSKETEQWHMISGEQETSMSGNGTIWALTRWVDHCRWRYVVPIHFAPQHRYREKIADVESPHPIAISCFFYFITLGDTSTGKQCLQLPML